MYSFYMETPRDPRSIRGGQLNESGHGETLAEQGSLDSLIRCLHRYVDANPDRFRVREERTRQQTILRVVLADDLQEDERRIFRPRQLR